MIPSSSAKRLLSTVQLYVCSLLVAPFCLAHHEVSAEEQSQKTNFVEVVSVEYPPFTTQNSSDNGIGFVLLERYLSSLSGVNFKPLFLPPARASKVTHSDDWCVSFYPVSAQSNPPHSFIQLREKPVGLGLIRNKREGVFEWN